MRSIMRSSSIARIERSPVPPWYTRTPTRPGPGRWARRRSGRDARRYSGSPRSVCVELLREIHPRRFQDLVRAAQLIDLAPQLLDLLALRRRGQIRPGAIVGFGLADT